MLTEPLYRIADHPVLAHCEVDLRERPQPSSVSSGDAARAHLKEQLQRVGSLTNSFFSFFFMRLGRAAVSGSVCSLSGAPLWRPASSSLRSSSHEEEELSGSAAPWLAFRAEAFAAARSAASLSLASGIPFVPRAFLHDTCPSAAVFRHNQPTKHGFFCMTNTRVPAPRPAFHTPCGYACVASHLLLRHGAVSCALPPEGTRQRAFLAVK